VEYLINSTFLFMEEGTRWRSWLRLRHKSEGRGFDSRWCHWDFSLTQSFLPHCGPGVDSVSNRNDYQEYFLWVKYDRCAGLTTFRHSCADCLEMWELQPPGISRDCPGLYMVCFALLMEGNREFKWFCYYFDMHLSWDLHQTNADVT